jgi:hypothetical protein
MRQKDSFNPTPGLFVWVRLFSKAIVKLKKLIPVATGLLFFYLIFNTSCANFGNGPSGGLKDTIPPVVVRTIPELRSKNFTGNDVRLTFDEFVISDEVSENLIISPPMKKRPLIKMKGKTLIVEFQEDLRKDRTYSLDFKDAVVDNNENNPIKDLRFSFSTGNTYDSLKVSGFVKNAYTQEPVEKALVLLYHQNKLTAVVDTIPDYIGKTDKDGFFVIDNLAKGTYRLFALTDADNSLTYNTTAELIAFDDSLIVPSAKYAARNDTVVKGNDTLLVTGHVDYLPKTRYLMMFEEEKFDQFLNSSKRSQGNRIDFYFAESLSDSFKVNLIKPKPQKEWSYIETNLKRDSITVWLTDTIFSNTDSLKFELQYEALDSLNKMYVKHDTLDMIYSIPKAPKAKRKKDEPVPVPTINLTTNINSQAHDLYQRILIEAPEPLTLFDTTKVKLYSVEDTVKTRISVQLKKDENSVRKYFIEYPWNENSNYELKVDSATAFNIYGHPSQKLDIKFKTQKEKFYGKIVLTLKGLASPAIVQLLGNNKDEKVLQKIQILEDGEIEFPYLKPEKYKLRIVIDKNKNGKWDTGYLAEGIQPEEVIYYPKIIKIKSNFEFRETWNIEYKPDYKKNLIDEDIEKEKARKKEQEKKAQGN